MCVVLIAAAAEVGHRRLRPHLAIVEAKHPHEAVGHRDEDGGHAGATAGDAEFAVLDIGLAVQRAGDAARGIVVGARGPGHLRMSPRASAPASRRNFPATQRTRPDRSGPRPAPALAIHSLQPLLRRIEPFGTPLTMASLTGCALRDIELVAGGHRSRPRSPDRRRGCRRSRPPVAWRPLRRHCRW